MANCSESGIFSSCRCEDFKCVLQQNYTYLEQNLDSMNGLISEMFQRRIITFQEKKFIEKFTNHRERNREVIDSLFDNKTLDHYLLFLDCLKASGQARIREALETKFACLSASSNMPEISPSLPCKNEIKQMDKIILEDKLAVIGICCMNGFISAICHMDPHIFFYMAMRPFIRLTYQEFDLPVKKDQFHFYDMVGCQEENLLIISDKAGKCLWLADVSNKSSTFRVIEGCPLRMFLSSYTTHCSDDEGYEDIYGDGCREDSAAKVDTSGCDCYDPGELVEALLFEKLLFVENLRATSEGSSTPPRTDDVSKSTLLVVVLSEGQYFVHFYSNTSNMRLLRKFSLMLSKEITTSNAVQRRDDGHVFVCYGNTDFGDRDNSPWYLGEYSPSGEMIRSYPSRPEVWIPRHLSMDETNRDVIYAVSRFSGEIIELKCRHDDEMLSITSVPVGKGKLSMPSRISFFLGKMDADCKGLFMLVGQGEIKKARPPASIVILKKV